VDLNESLRKEVKNMFARQGTTKNRTKGFIMVSFLTLLLLSGMTFLSSLSSAVEATLTDDAYTYSGSKTMKYGTQTILSVRGLAGGAPLKRSFLKFDLSTLPGGTTGGDVQKATLKLFVRNLATAGSFDVFRVAADWNETTITHQVAPPFGGVVASSVAVDDENIFVTVDLTTLMRDWLNGTVQNYGIAILPNIEGITVDFDSKENTTTSHEARLEIVLLGRPQGAGALGVYDGNGLFLGYLVHVDPTEYRIFNPSIPAFLKVPLTVESPGGFFLLKGDDIFRFIYPNDDCTSQPYVDPNACGFHSLCVYHGVEPFIYYIYDTESQFPTVRLEDMHSYKDIKTGVCTSSGGGGTAGGQTAAYPVKQIDVPFLYTQPGYQILQYPIIVKPIQ
jgi:hypothetical protein